MGAGGQLGLGHLRDSYRAVRTNDQMFAAIFPSTLTITCVLTLAVCKLPKMHSILESDGVSSDPCEVLCHMGTLIIEGRIPKAVAEATASGETAAKSVKPYSEGPHCPNFMKLHNKDTHNVHKCAENNILCIRYNNLKQHLQTLLQKSSSIAFEVSLGPDCLCGELRSQSTLVSTQPSKRDVILEQWTVTIGQKQMQEPSSHMSVTNLYQAVRSLLHFSQLTAWYMCNNGLKPCHVIYRVGVPEDSTFICDDNFVSHDFPVADINKTVWMKISVKTLPRMEKIPSVFCPQHPTATVEAPQGSQESTDKNYLSPDPLHSKFTEKSEEQLVENSLLLRYQGVRKKTYEAQEGKRKKYIGLYSPPQTFRIDCCPEAEFLDGMPVDGVSVKKTSPETEEKYFGRKKMFQGESLVSYLGESSKSELKKTKACCRPADLPGLVKPHSSFQIFDSFSCNYFEHEGVDPTLDMMIGVKSFSDSKSKCDFRTKGKTKMNDSEDAETILETKRTESKTVMDILDDRMQISCAISGKHHCKWECEEDGELSSAGGNVEKPKRRRSVSRAKGGDTTEDARSDSEKILHGKFKEVECCESCSPLREDEAEESSDNSADGPRFHLESPPKPKTIVDISSSPSGNAMKPLTPKIESLPHSNLTCVQAADELTSESSSRKASDVWVRKESFESFKKGCAVVRDTLPDCSSDSDSELSDSCPEASNPFLAAILRTARKSKTKKKCDSSIKHGVERLKETSAASEKVCARVGVQSSSGRWSPRRPKLDLSGRVQSRRTDDGGECSGGSRLETEPRKLTKSFPDEQDLKGEEKASSSCEDLEEEIGSNNGNSTKTIPVPSAHDKLKFRRSLDSAAQLVFHRCSGLPLTSSPAPVRRNNNSFSFDSTLNSVSAIKSALFEPSNSLSSEDENESEGSLKSPASPGAWSVGSKQINYHSLSPLPLLGSFEESVLNGRLEPVSTVHGFTAELGASGSFCPNHMHLPVTVFFYTLGDNDKVSAPYLGHINLGKKGYNVPRSGTIQVTLFNPLRTVVKMFVVVYDLHDMPPNSHTFLRQRTLYVPASQKEADTLTDQEDYHKYLRYLVHLRFVSGKTGRIYLHTDIRMVIFRKADEDTATALDDGETYELRSHTHGPVNPKFSPRK